jgi:formate-dependent nitrite reductase cytochrome c552 subunit
MRKGIILGIGILVILLALAGTGSAKSGFTGGVVSCTYCHPSGYTPNAAGEQYKLIHKFDGVTYPTTSVSCANCHTNMTTTFFPLTSNGSSYNSTHRYNATTLASVKLIGNDGCNNCHVNAVNGDFNLSTGAKMYLGSAICEDCHKAKYDIWSNTTHAVMLTPAAKANETMNLPLPPQLSDWSGISYVLVTKFQFSYINTTGYWLAQNDTYNTETKTFGQVEYNASSAYTGTNGYGTCARCHTTGYNATGDNSSLPGIIGNFSETGIACERCHGAAGNGHQVTNYSATLCTDCHSGSHHGTRWENGTHAPPAARNGTTCSQCHSPFDKYQNNGSASTVNSINVACGVCHDTHDITDSKYTETFNGFTVGNFAADTWSVVADAKLSFFNGTASRAAGTDKFDDLEAESALSGVDVSTIMCSKCHTPYHGLGHTPYGNLSHGNVSAPATCIDCHMEGASATVGRDMMNNHDNKIVSGASCGGAKCHGKAGISSMQKRYEEWGASLHNEVGFYADEEAAGVQPNCKKCHDPLNWDPSKDYNSTTGLVNTIPVPLEKFKGVTCTVCHNLHDMGNWFAATFLAFGEEKAYGLFEKVKVGDKYRGKYTMVENTTALCGNCHASVRIGRSEAGWVNDTVTTPNRTHGFPAADIFVGSWKQTGSLKFECTSCHYATMRNYANGTSLPYDQRIGGHLFEVNATLLMNNSRDCYTCHITGSKLGNISTSIENAQEGVQDKYNDTKVIVDAALASVNASTGEKSLSRDKIAVAYWNYRLVGSDKSWGVHDPVGTRKLLNDAVTLANEAVSSLGQATSSVDLVVGWNLVALKGTPLKTAPVDVLSSVSSNITVVWGYNASASNPIDKWELYDPAMPLGLNDLKTMVPGKGYWINAIKACKWTV